MTYLDNYGSEAPASRFFEVESEFSQTSQRLGDSRTPLDFATTSSQIVANQSFFVVESSAISGTGLPRAPESQTSFVYGPVLPAECALRLRTLETFEGDPSLGFERPEGKAVEAVRTLLTAMYKACPPIESPVISPAQDGEIIVSWRRRGGFLTCHFVDDSHFEWVFEKSFMITGNADATNRETQSGLAWAVLLLCEPNADLAILDHSNATVNARSAIADRLLQSV